MFPPLFSYASTAFFRSRVFGARHEAQRVECRVTVTSRRVAQPVVGVGIARIARDDSLQEPDRRREILRLRIGHLLAEKRRECSRRNAVRRSCRSLAGPLLPLEHWLRSRTCAGGVYANSHRDL